MRDVFQDRFDNRFPPRVAHVVLYRVQAAQFDTGSPNGIVAIHSRGHISLDGRLQILLQFFIEFLLEPFLPNQSTEGTYETRHETHSYSSPREAARILAIAAVCTSHSRVS